MLKAKIIIPLLLTALAFGLNLHGLAADSFWGDEILTANFASRSPAEVIDWTREDIHPPLYYLAAGFFTRLTVPLGISEQPNATSDWLWRFPSVIAVVLTVAVTYRLSYCVVRSAYSTSHSTHHALQNTHYALPTGGLRLRFTFYTPLLLTFAPIAIKYGQEARMHALFMLFSALSTWLLFRAIDRPQQWGRWLAFALATTASIYTMYFGFLILAAQTALLLLPTGKSSLRFSPYVLRLFPGFVSAVVLAFLLYLPWWPNLFEILRKRAAVGAIEGGVGAPLEFVLGVVEALGPAPIPAAWLFLGLFGAGLFFLAREQWPLAGFAALWLILPTALPIVLGDPRALQFRYAFVLPVYLAVIAYAIFKISHLSYLRLSRSGRAGAAAYMVWVLITLSFIAILDIYDLTKPNWRAAAAYLDEHSQPADIIIIGPLWDEGRFIDYYYRGQAQLLTPAAMVTNIERRAEALRQNGGRVWAVNRFEPRETPASKNLAFSGVVVSEPQLVVYEPAILSEAAIDLAAQAVEAAYPWAAEAKAGGILDPDPRTAQAAALQAWGDALMAAGRPQEAVKHYQRAVDIFPGSAHGFIALAEAQHAVGNLPAAVKAYQQAVAFNQAWQGPEADEAAALVRTGQWETAFKKYHLIVEE